MAEIEKVMKNIYSHTFGKYSLASLLSKELEEGWKVLDVGCGRRSALLDVQQRKNMFTVGLDHYEPYIVQSKNQAIHNEYVKGDARQLTSIFGEKSFDCVIATEVLEHLTKKDGIRMMRQMEKVAKRKIILTTPNGFLPTYAGPKDNPTESHLCGWTTKELNRLGFKVHGFNGYKRMWNIIDGQVDMRLKPKKIFYRVNQMANMVFYRIPESAFQLFFIKNLSDVASN